MERSEINFKYQSRQTELRIHEGEEIIFQRFSFPCRLETNIFFE